jgi:hypothetical protein
VRVEENQGGVAAQFAVESQPDECRKKDHIAGVEVRNA